MKLFVSYGHDANAGLVHLVKDALRAAGHAPWIDSEEIHKANDWRRALMDAAVQADWTVGFLSRHAMREGGVTLQEIAIAEDIKGGCVTTVLVEKLTDWEPPPGIARHQWVDMSDWAAQEALGPAIYDAWFTAKMAELLHRLRPEAAAAHAAEMQVLTELINSGGKVYH